MNVTRKLKRSFYQSSVILLPGVMTLPLHGCGGEGTFSRIYENVWQTERVEPKNYYEPSTAAELVSIVQQAQTDNRRVRMTGSGHSPSDVTVTEDILLYPKNLSGLLTLEDNQLKPFDESITLRSGTKMDVNLVRVKSGTTIRQLNTAFDRYRANNGKGLAFPILGGWDAQTIAGATMTATHGSSLELGALDSIIASMQVVTKDGRMLQVEPNDGITDPEKFSGFLTEDNNIPVELVQDDDVFNAMKVSFGSMGIVYSYVLKVFDKYWITENREITTWEDITAPNGFLSRLVAGKKLNPKGVEPDFYELQVNPYPVEGKHNVLLTRRWASKTPLPASPFRAARGSDALQQVAVTFQGVIEGVVNATPSLAERTLNTALEAQVDEEYINQSHRVFNIGVINRTRVYALEVAFPLDEIIRATEAQFDIIQSLRADDVVQMAPLALRFVKASDSTLSMMNGQDTAMMEIINLQGLDDVHKYFKQHQYQLLDRNQFTSRPHWGLDFNYLKTSDAIIDCEKGKEIPVDDFYVNLNFERLRTAFPRVNFSDNKEGVMVINRRNLNVDDHYIKIGDQFVECQNPSRFAPELYYGDNWNRWKAIYDEYNPKGTFSGKTTDRLGV